jgi:hypothetical protein
VGLVFDLPGYFLQEPVDEVDPSVDVANGIGPMPLRAGRRGIAEKQLASDHGFGTVHSIRDSDSGECRSDSIGIVVVGQLAFVISAEKWSLGGYFASPLRSGRGVRLATIGCSRKGLAISLSRFQPTNACFEFLP